MKKIIGTAALCAAVMASGSAFAFECKRGEASFDKPGGFPERALTMTVPYGPVLDHLIITRSGYYSFADAGAL